MEMLKQLLNKECDRRLSEQALDAFTGLMSEMKLKNHQPLISYGQFDDNVYVVKDGILRFVYFDGLKEMTFGFSTPGTVIIQYHSFYRREPSFFQIESCGRSTVMKVSRADFEELKTTSDNFLQWMFRIQAAQLWLYEKRLAVVNGSAKERLESLVRQRPEILEKVSSKVIASYIGVTPSSLSRLKRELRKKST